MTSRRQIAAIEDAIARGDDGILITPDGPGVNPAIEKARDAGLYVIALDTPPDPPDTVDITFATDNFEAGELIGQWTKAPARRREGDHRDARPVQRQDRLGRLRPRPGLPDRHGHRHRRPEGQRRRGRDRQLRRRRVRDRLQRAHRRAPRTAAARRWRTACQQNPDINVVYTINEPAAAGAYAALEQAGSAEGVLIVSVDGGCDGVEQVKDGVIGATSQQYPLKMAELGVKAIADVAGGGDAPENTEGLDFYNTGVALVTDKPVDGVESIDTTEGADLCWG